MDTGEMMPTVTVAEEVRAAIPDRDWKRLCAAFTFAPYQRCDECGQTIDLRIEPANLIVCRVTDTEDQFTYTLSHPLCAPSQLVEMDSAERDRADGRWFGQQIGHGFYFFERVPAADGAEHLVLVVELQNTGIIFHEEADGTVTAVSDVLEALVEQDGFERLSVVTGLADLPKAPEWRVLLTPQGALNAVVGVPGRKAVSSAGVFIGSGGSGGADPGVADLLTARSSVTLLVVPPATFGLPKIHQLADDQSNLETAFTSLVSNVVGLAAKEDPSVPLTDRKAFLRAIANGRIAGAQVDVDREADPARTQ